MSRRFGIFVLVASLMALPLVAQAGKSRTASGHYNTVMLTPEEDSPSLEGHYSNGVKFKLRPGERFISVVIEDDAGMPVRATIGQDHDGDGTTDHEQEICGATTQPIKLMPAHPVIVWAQEGPCADGTNALATFGKVTATFTR